MKQAVQDVESQMQAAGQQTPPGPAITDTAKQYLGDPLDMRFDPMTGRPVLGGIVGDEVVSLAAAWCRRDDVGVFLAALQVVWTTIAGLRALGFPIEEGWMELALAKQAGGQPDLRQALNEHGFKALQAKLTGQAAFGAIRVQQTDPNYIPDPCTD